MDWTEQRHHLSGALGRGLLDRLFELDWVRPTEQTRALRVTKTGWEGMRTTFGVRTS